MNRQQLPSGDSADRREARSTCARVLRSIRKADCLAIKLHKAAADADSLVSTYWQKGNSTPARWLSADLRTAAAHTASLASHLRCRLEHEKNL